ncbi:MAG: 5-formyltetrahydrofolate cyclo-ligase [Candidatus Omnitrophica bacterium]|nr:5-formyltetrahydrofolate cyclo-ligase [Candidatus Omnitrophota bacterium]
MLTKERLRSKILSILRSQREEERLKKSRIIKNKLFRLDVFKKAKRIMFYLAYDGEVETKEMIAEAIKRGKIIAVPVCRKKEKKIIPCKIGLNTRFKKGPYGIKKPCKEVPLSVKNLDLVVVPGVAFDREGRRLGRGKGYYDYFLKTLPKKTVSLGLAFDFQLVPRVPVLPQDVPVSKVLFA